MGELKGGRRGEGMPCQPSPVPTLPIRFPAAEPVHRLDCCIVISQMASVYISA